MRWIETKPLSTYRVDKELIHDIEEYCSNRIPRILNIKEPVIKHLLISVLSKHTQEEYETTLDIQNRLFHDSVRAIIIEYNFYDRNEGIVLITSFDKNSEKSYIKLAVYHDMPKETIAGIRDGIFSLIREKKNANRFFYLKEHILLPILVIGVLMGIGGILSGVKEVRLISITSLAILLLYVGFFRFLVGYSSFDSKRQKCIESITKWFLLAIAGFLISTLLTPLRKLIFGF